jgi:hypothetical protein
MISILVLTLNEENNIASCLESVEWSDDIIVLDSFSNDKTVEIARQYGARIYQRKFDDENYHRTYSIREIPFKYPWVYNPDADEITTAKLRDEMLTVVSDAKRDEVAYRVRFKTMFNDKWLRYSSLYPTWVVRLFQPEKIHFERKTNLYYNINGKVGYLQNHFLHYTFNNGYAAWFDKHNKYSSEEAAEYLRSLNSSNFNPAELISTNSVKRRRSLKELSIRLPFRPTLRFLYMYFLRLGFLDGAAGFTYCRLLSIYEYMIVLKMKELKRREKGLSL